LGHITIVRNIHLPKLKESGRIGQPTMLEGNAMVVRNMPLLPIDDKSRDMKIGLVGGKNLSLFSL
jgi:hypothetical protein